MRFIALLKKVDVNAIVMPEDNQQLSEYVLEAIRNGQRIEALKRIRNEKGLGLKDAKKLVDEEIALNHADNPHYQSKPFQIPLLAVILVASVLTVVTCYIIVSLRLRDTPRSPNLEPTNFLRQ